MNDWEFAGVLVRLGDQACKHARKHNENVDVKGCHSTDTEAEWYAFQTVLDCIRCFKGFDVDWTVCEEDTRKIKEFSIRYDSEKIGIPWKVVR